MARIGFVGLGVMGGPMAGHVLASGTDLIVWNRTPSKAEPLAAAGAKVAPSLADLASNADVILLCVSRSEDVEACTTEMMPWAKPGTLFVDHSTIAPATAVALEKALRNRGFRFVDAPITGGSVGAQKGQLTIFMGGNKDDVAEAQAVARPYTKRSERVGGPGAGQMAKMANQIAVAGSLLGLCEALSFAEKAGLDIAQIRELVGGGAGGSWSFDNYGTKVLNRDWTPGFSVANQRKDLGYVREAAKETGAAVPGAELVDQLLAHLSEEGHGDWATPALFEVLLRLGDRAP